MHQRQQRGVSGPSSRFLKGPPSRVNPEVARETALSKVQKLEQALHLMSDCPGPAADVLKQELGKARAASKKPPIDVEVEQCSKFIARAGQMVAELDAERAAEFGALQASNKDPSVPLHSTPDCAEIVALKAKLAEVEGERDAALRSQSNKRLATMSSVAAAAASGGSSAEGAEGIERLVAAVPRGVGEALVTGDETRVMEASPRLSWRRESELMEVMVP